MRLSFHGAAREVTGSCHLLEVGDHRILIDCGMHQGGDEAEASNRTPFQFDPADIDAVVLTHAHLDHCGRLPLLARQGFEGPVYCTAATRDLARIVLMDAAKIQEEDAYRNARYAARAGREPEPPLYETEDALLVLDHFDGTLRYGERFDLAEDLAVTPSDAGHILGSACMLFEVQEGTRSRRVLFSGDIGNNDKPIIRDPAPAPEADIVVMETTYGDRNHRPFQKSIEELYGVIKETLKRGGNILIPTFALERAQELLYILRDGVDQRLLPKDLPVFLDSPMAIKATDVFRRHPGMYDEEMAAVFKQGRDPFALPGLRMTRDVRQSMEINHIDGGAVILAGSGMCTGGRIKHHLKRNLWRESSSVVFVSFAPKHTLARVLIDGAKRVRLHGQEVKVRAHIHTINGFSAHAGVRELLDWHEGTGQPEATFLVHGDPQAMDPFGRLLRDRGHKVELPKKNQAFNL